MDADGESQQPYCFEVDGGELFAFAGLWDRAMGFSDLDQIGSFW